jgi:hypothetical protein
MRSRSLLLILIAVFLLVALRPCYAAAETDFRYEMLVSAHIDGYPTDDDVTAIARYLRAVGDEKLAVPGDVADWIVGRIGHLGPSATPRLIGAYMHFLRCGAVAPPFDGGASATARNRLLRAMAGDLQARATPVANLALLMFQEINDPVLRQLADTADYAALRAFPWLLGYDDWMDWIFDGLHPDDFLHSSQAIQNSPDFPVASDQAKAGLLMHVRAFISNLDIRPPVSASSINFIGFMNAGNSWGHLKGGPTVPLVDWNEARIQETSQAKMMSHRIATTLGMPDADDQSVENLVRADMTFGLPGYQIARLGELYRSSLGILKQPPGQIQTPDRFARLSSALVSQQWRLLALGSYALVAYQRNHHGPASDIGMDRVFSRLTATDLPASEKKTTIVSAIAASEASAAASVDVSALSKCNLKSFQVVKRLVSLRDRQFLETVNAACADDSSIQFSKLGIVSTDLTRMLEVNPNYLDIVQVSLTLRDLTASTSARRETPDDLDLVRASPNLATVLNLAAQAHPEAPWGYVRDVLLKDWPVTIDWLTPGWRPQPPTITIFPTPGRLVMLPSTDFTTWRDSVFLGETELLEAEAGWRYYHGVWPTVDAMPEKVGECDPITYALSGGQCPNMQFTARNRLMTQLNDIATEANKHVQLSISVAATACLAPHAHDLDSINIAIDAETGEFATVYDTGVCYGGARGDRTKLHFPPAMDDWLQRALKQDPIFLNRYQLDLLSSSDDWPKRLISALSFAWEESSVASRTLSYLQSTDLLYYLPSPTTPLGSGYPVSWQNSSDARKMALDTMTAPLLKSQAGQDFAEDLAAIQNLVTILPPAASNHTDITDDFMGRLRTAQQESIKNVDEQVDAEVATMNAQLSPQTQSNFEIGFSIGMGQASGIGLYFSYKGVPISIAFPLTSPAPGAPTLPPITIPAVPLMSPTRSIAGETELLAGDTIGPDFSGGSVPALGAQDSTSISSEINTSLPELNWASLLAQSNYVGRTWLNNQVALATPLLTPEQLAQISEGLNQPTFPADLAKLVATKAAEASSNTNGSPVDGPITGQSAINTCKTGTWSNCGIAVKQELDKNPADPKEVIALAGLWGKAFDAQYHALRQTGHLEQATPDDERVEEILNGILNPIDIATDHAEDAILKQCLGGFGFIVEWSSNPAVGTLKTFFDNSPEVATDYDELLLMDDLIQREVGEQLEPFMKPTWQTQLSQAIDQAAPQWAPKP